MEDNKGKLSEKIEHEDLFEVINENDKTSYAIQRKKERQKIVNSVKTKPYDLEHKAEYIGFIVFFVVCSLIGAFLSQFTIVENVLNANSDSFFKIIISFIVFILFCGLYSIEFINLLKISERKYKNSFYGVKIKVGAFNWILAFLISTINIGMVTSGAYYQTIVNDTKFEKINVDKQKDSLKIATNYDIEIARLQTQVSIINKNADRLWKNQRVGYTKEDKINLSKYEDKISDLRDNKNSDLKDWSLNKTTELTETKKDLFDVIKLKILFALLIEIIIIFCIIGIAKYRTGVLFEFETLKSNKGVRTNKNNSAHHSAAMNIDKNIHEDEKKKFFQVN